MRARSTVLLMILGAMGLGLSLSSCLRTQSVRSGENCVSTREFFARQVWAPFMSTTCYKCHASDGMAVMKRGAKFVLQPPAYPGFLDANLANLREISRIEYDGLSELLRKPIGQMAHGGGSPLKEDSAQYAALRELVQRLRAPEQCSESKPVPALAQVQTLDAAATFRKAALSLNGRLPTPQEQQEFTTKGDAALEGALNGLLKEEAFYARLKELFNDVLLTDKFRWRGYPVAIQQLNAEDFPSAMELRRKWDTTKWTDLPEEERRKVNDSLAREPLDLIAYVVRNDRPFTEILTAGYTVVDDSLAQLYGIQDGKTGEREAQLQLRSGTPYPHAGILSTPMFVNRWQTTPTNRSRGRARFLLKEFLATDILKLGERPVDVALVTKVDNPTMNAESCVVCHRILDPVAGGFRGWDEHDYERFKGDRPWHDEMQHPGFGSAQLPPEEYGRALPWLAKQITNDVRFDRAAAQFVFKALTGREPLPYPTAPDRDFDAKLAAWEAEDAFLRSAIDRYVAEHRNLKSLFKSVITSVYFRASHVKQTSPALEGVGTARLLTPEQLNRKIVATTGVHWRKPWDWPKPPQDWLADNGMLVLYGGIDSDNITDRVSTMSSIMSNLSQRMANETACLAVPTDFSLPKEQRALFPFVQLDEVPFAAGHPVEDAATNIRRNIVALHERLLGEQLSENDPEIEATYQLFIDTWKEGAGGEARKSALRYPCIMNAHDGSKLADPIRRDAQYTVRAWMAVVTYLLSDYRFLYE